MVYDAYNLSFAGNSSGIVDLMQATNTHYMFNMFGIMLLLAITLIAYMAFFNSSQDTNRSMAGAMWVAFSISIPLMILELLPDWILFITLTGLALSVAFLRS